MAAGCAACPCSRPAEKFESGTGWPSFTAPYAEGHLKLVRDTSYGMVRIETLLRAAATATRATSSPTARRRPASATASTRSRSSSRRAGSPCPTSWAAARASPRPDLRRRPIPPGLGPESV